MLKTVKSIILMFALIFVGRADGSDLNIAVIVNSTGPLVNATDEDIKEIYLGEKRFEGGVMISPLLYPEGEIKDIFLRETVKMTPKEYKLYWTKKVFQEGLHVPKTIGNPIGIVNTVRENKGGIGFIGKEFLKDLSGIKIITSIKK